MPPRVFDLLPRYVEKFGWKDNLFAGKEKGEWIKYDGKAFCAMTDAISRGFIKLGVGKGDRVALVANNSPQWNMVDFAIQQVGAITIPIYSTISHDDYAYILKHSEAKAILLKAVPFIEKLRILLKVSQASNMSFPCIRLMNSNRLTTFWESEMKTWT